MLVSRLVGAVGVMGVIGGVWLLLVFFGVAEGDQGRQGGTLLLALALLAVGIPALVYRIRDILS